jgi:hypothetical protein
MSPRKSTQYYVQDVHEYLAVLPGDKKFRRRPLIHSQGGYMPDLGESPELDPATVNFFQSQIGILSWCVELGRIANINEVAMLSTKLCLPCGAGAH